MNSDELERLIPYTMWAVEGEIYALYKWEDALREGTFHEYRPPEYDDIDVHQIVDDFWEWLAEDLRYDEYLSWDEGGPVLEPPPRGSLGHSRLTHVLRDLLEHQLDLSEAAWQPTGRVRRIAPDGTWTEVAP